MSSDFGASGTATCRPSREVIVAKIAAGCLSEVSYSGLEFKSKWDTEYGKDISAIANQESLAGGWFVVGVDDRGIPCGRDKRWIEGVERLVSEQVSSFFSPLWAIKEIFVEELTEGHYLLVEIQNPGDVTEWRGEAYKRKGTVTTVMTAAERAALALRLPGDDYSCQRWEGAINGALVLDFADKIKKSSAENFPEDLAELSSAEILRLLQLDGKKVAGILFGDVRVRIAHYDINEDVISNAEKKGAYSILTDEFIAQIQSWPERKGTVLKGNTTSVTEEEPYPSQVVARSVSECCCTCSLSKMGWRNCRQRVSRSC